MSCSLCLNSYSGWTRNLIAEGIEANPGPTWDEFVEAFDKKFKAGIPKPVETALQKLHDSISTAFPDKLFIDTKLITRYLKDNAANHDEQLVDLVKEIINSLEGGESLL